jgi:hypothetical protein
MPKTKPDKYTEEFVLNEVESILEEIKRDRTIVYLKTVFENKEYTHQRYSEWTKEFKENKQISDTIKKTKEILESRINNQGLKGELSVPMVIFNLKNNYGWTDSQRIDHTTKGEKITEMRDDTKEELSKVLLTHGLINEDQCNGLKSSQTKTLDEKPAD